MSLKSRERSICPCQYRTLSISRFSVGAITASKDRDLVIAGSHQRGGTQANVAALRLPVLAGERERSHVIDAGNFIDHAHDFGTIDVAAEGPAVAVRTALERVQEFVERGHDGGL